MTWPVCLTLLGKATYVGFPKLNQKRKRWRPQKIGGLKAVFALRTCDRKGEDGLPTSCIFFFPPTHPGSSAMQKDYFILRVVRSSSEWNLVTSIIRLNRACLSQIYYLCVREIPQIIEMLIDAYGIITVCLGAFESSVLVCKAGKSLLSKIITTLAPLGQRRNNGVPTSMRLFKIIYL